LRKRLNSYILLIEEIILEIQMKDNKHTLAIPQEVLTQAQTKINEVSALLTPYIVVLTPAERHELPKTGEKPISFVEKAYDFANQNPNLVPPYLDINAFGTDFGDAHGLWTLVNSIRQLYENASDTETIVGSEAYQAALVFHESVKMVAIQDIPGAKAVYGGTENPPSRGVNGRSVDWDGNHNRSRQKGC
jgi:hypothetical protein